MLGSLRQGHRDPTRPQRTAPVSVVLRASPSDVDRFVGGKLDLVEADKKGGSHGDRNRPGASRRHADMGPVHGIPPG